MGLTGVHWSETTMRYVAARYLSNRQLTHHALRDAQDQMETTSAFIPWFPRQRNRLWRLD